MSVVRQGFYKLLVYVPIDAEEYVHEYVEKCKGTETSASQRIVEFIREDLVKLNAESEKVQLVCVNCNKVFREGALVRFASGLKELICQECFDDRFKRGLIRAVLKEYR